MMLQLDLSKFIQNETGKSAARTNKFSFIKCSGYDLTIPYNNGNMGMNFVFFLKTPDKLLRKTTFYEYKGHP